MNLRLSCWVLLGRAKRDVFSMLVNKTSRTIGIRTEGIKCKRNNVPGDLKGQIDVDGEQERVARLSRRCPYFGSISQLSGTSDLAGGKSDRGEDI